MKIGISLEDIKDTLDELGEGAYMALDGKLRLIENCLKDNLVEAALTYFLDEEDEDYKSDRPLLNLIISDDSYEKLFTKELEHRWAPYFASIINPENQIGIQRIENIPLASLMQIVRGIELYDLPKYLPQDLKLDIEKQTEIYLCAAYHGNLKSIWKLIEQFKNADRIDLDFIEKLKIAIDQCSNVYLNAPAIQLLKQYFLLQVADKYISADDKDTASTYLREAITPPISERNSLFSQEKKTMNQYATFILGAGITREDVSAEQRRINQRFSSLPHILSDINPEIQQSQTRRH